MTLILAFRENGKNHLVADKFVTKLDSANNKYEIVRPDDNKIKHGKNFVLALTAENIAILDLFEHAIADIQLEGTKEAIYNMLVALNKRIANEFIFVREPKNLTYE